MYNSCWLQVADSLEENEERVISYLPYKSDLLHDTFQIFGIRFNPVAKHQNPNRKSMESLSVTHDRQPRPCWENALSSLTGDGSSFPLGLLCG